MAMSVAGRNRFLKKSRKKWASQAALALRRNRFDRRLRLCLALALMAEGLVLGADSFSFERWRELGSYAGPQQGREEEDGRLIRGLEVLIEDGKLQLFEIREYSQPEND